MRSSIGCAVFGWPQYLGALDWGNAMSCGIGQAQAAGQAQVTGQPDQLPPMTAESARRLAALLAPQVMAMRIITAGTRYGARADIDSETEQNRPSLRIEPAAQRR